jgi:hypothetical protein
MFAQCERYVTWSWHPEKHLVHGMLKDGDFFAGPNAAGQVFREAVKRESRTPR